MCIGVINNCHNLSSAVTYPTGQNVREIPLYQGQDITDITGIYSDLLHQDLSPLSLDVIYLKYLAR